jgi:S1-C subfamily serine protease
MVVFSTGLLPITGFCQPRLIDPNSITFIGAESVASTLAKTVFAVQVAQIKQDNSVNWSPVGSGFFVLSTAASNNLVLGVTCNHVVDVAQHLSGSDGYRKELYVGVNTDAGYERCSFKVVYQDPTNDIAVIFPEKGTNASVNLQNLVIPDSFYDDGGSLVLGRGTLTIGYPLKLGAEGDRNSPVVRFGMVAQNSGGNSFLIDGMASHGNSGSPVFSLGAEKQLLIGMVNSFQSDQITLFDEHGGIAAALPYNSGLASAVKASVILDAVRVATKRIR